jgi:hypothetical protein
MHGVESYISPFTGFYFRLYRGDPLVLKRTIGPNLIDPNGTQWGGEKLDTYRAASVHTVPDEFGFRAPTPYSAHRWTENRPVVNYKFYTWTPFECIGFVWIATPPSGASSSLLNQLQAEAETLCLGKFAQGSVDLSVAFLERRQTANMVTDWCTSTVRLLKDLRKGRWVKGRLPGSKKVWKWDKNLPRGWTPKALQQWRNGEAITSLPNAWLTTRYGIAPSLMDIAGSVEAISNADKGKFDRYIATNHSRRFKVESVVSPFLYNYIGTYYAMPVKRHTTEFRKHEVSVRIDATIDESFYLTLQDVGLTNPLLTGWEVLPYSFVLDWFIGVGDFLSAINAWNTGYKFKSGSCTRYYDLEKREYAEPLNVSGYTNTVLEAPTQPSHKLTGFTRTPYYTAPVPSIVMKRDPLNFERMWDSVFLLSNLLGSKSHATKVKDRMRNLRI